MSGLVQKLLQNYDQKTPTITPPPTKDFRPPPPLKLMKKPRPPSRSFATPSIYFNNSSLINPYKLFHLTSKSSLDNVSYKDDYT